MDNKELHETIKIDVDNIENRVNGKVMEVDFADIFPSDSGISFEVVSEEK